MLKGTHWVQRSMSLSFSWTLATHLSSVPKIQIMFDILPPLNSKKDINGVNLFKSTDSLAAGASLQVQVNWNFN